MTRREQIQQIRAHITKLQGDLDATRFYKCRIRTQIKWCEDRIWMIERGFDLAIKHCPHAMGPSEYGGRHVRGDELNEGDWHSGDPVEALRLDIQERRRIILGARR